MGGSRDENEGRVRVELALARQESADELSFKLFLSSKTFAQMFNSCMARSWQK